MTKVEVAGNAITKAKVAASAMIETEKLLEGKVAADRSCRRQKSKVAGDRLCR